MNFGTLKNIKNAVFIALGTGIGGDALMNGISLRSLNPSSAEIGHMIIHRNGEKCACGNRGCFEKYASGSALNRLAESAWQIRTLYSAVLHYRR